MTTTSRYPVTQARQPSGVPNGGQFREEQKAVATVTLPEISDEQYNQDGSYRYPPAPRSAVQHIKFWESVPLPDEKLDALISGYSKLREQVGIEAGNAAAEAWKRTHPDPTEHTNYPKAGAVERWQADGMAVHKAAYDEAIAPMPERIYRTTVRPLLRAHQMHYYAGALPRSERSVVHDHTVVVDGKPMTVQQVEDTYRLSRITAKLM